MLAELETTRPEAETTRSTWIRPRARAQAANMEPTTQMVPRAERGTGIARMPADGDWTSSTTGRRGSSSAVVRLVALEERGGDSCMAGTLRLHMTVLLRPELTIQGAAFKQCAVRCDVDQLAFFQHQDLVALGQR